MDAEVLAEGRQISLDDLESTGELCTIRKIVLVDLPSGGQEETSQDIGPYPCKVQQDRQPVEVEGQAQVVARTFWWVVLPWDVVTFDKKALLRVEDQSGETREYQVIEVNFGRTNRLTTLAYVATNE